MSNTQIIEALFQGETIETLKHNLGLTVEEINEALSNTDLVVCPHCETVSNIGGLIGEFTNDCPVCGTQILKG
jgi:uncharacterized paraquat-inducible protein A